MWIIAHNWHFVWNCYFLLNGDGTLVVKSDGDNAVIFIYSSHCIWLVPWIAYTVSKLNYSSEVPSGVKIWQCLKTVEALSRSMMIKCFALTNKNMSITWHDSSDGSQSGHKDYISWAVKVLFQLININFVGC